MKGKRLLLGLSTLGLLFAAGIRPSQNMLLAEEASSSSSMPEHWSSSTLDDNNSPIVSPYLSASAYKDSSKGNSIRMSRRISAYTLSVSSSSFEAKKDTAYKLAFFYRSDCLHDEENKVTASLIETKDDGSTVSTEVISANGRESNWKQLNGYYTTSSQCASLVMVFSCYGMGDFFINGPSLAGKPAPSTFFGNFGIENKTEDSGNFQPLTASNLSDDAYSGERSIKLTDQGFRTNFDELPAGDYELRFKYKHDYEDGSRLSLRIDNVTSDGTKRLWYADPVGPNGTGGGWSTYSYKFKKLPLNSGDKYCAINYIKIFSHKTFYIDDLEILNSSNFNYVAGGSFEGYDIENISLSGATGIVKDHDGSLVYAGSYDSVLGTSVEPSLKVETSNFDLTIGNTYTLKYQYRGGYFETASAYYGSDKIYTGNYSEDWTDVSVDFVASEGKDLKLQFCTSSPRTAYIRNISITDTAEVEKMPEVIKEYDSSAGESIDSFPYGDMKTDEPETSESGETSSSSSESEETSFSQETRSEEQEESTSKPSSSSQPSTSSSEPSSENQNSSSGDSTATKALLGVTIAMLTVATAGLATAIVIMIRGRKNG